MRSARGKRRYGECSYEGSLSSAKLEGVGDSHAAETLSTGAQFSLVTPQGVRWTDKPVVVCRIELDGVSEGEDTWSTDQRHVMKVNHIVAAPIKNATNAPTVCDRTAGLLC